MPATPTGGLSIFINLTILIVGNFVKLIKKTGYKFVALTYLYTLITDKNYNNKFRKVLGYSTALSLFLVVFVSTSFSIYNRLINESNYDIFAPKVSSVIHDVARLIADVKPDIEEKVAPVIDEVLENNIVAVLIKK